MRFSTKAVESRHKKARSYFLYLRLRAYSKRLPSVSFTLDSSENGEERLPSFRFIISTAVEGCSYAEGAQRGSNATPLRVPASGGVWLSNELPSPHAVSD